MPLIAIRLYPPLSEKAGSATVSAEGATVGEALRNLSGRLGPSFSAALFDDGKPKRYLTFVLNRRILEPAGVDRAKLSEGDTLQIYPAIAGG
jgi:molybdopterin converting factor small subunit